jgi:hypothetical protein
MVIFKIGSPELFGHPGFDLDSPDLFLLNSWD